MFINIPYTSTELGFVLDRRPGSQIGPVLVEHASTEHSLEHSPTEHLPHTTINTARVLAAADRLNGTRHSIIATVLATACRAAPSLVLIYMFR